MGDNLLLLFLKKNVKFLLYGLFLLLFLGPVSIAQQRTVTGMVTASDDGSPLVGVTVVIQGTTTGTITDANGKYSITVPGGGAVLQFSFVGYTTQTIPVGNQTVINVVLEPSTIAMNEVVVTSLGIRKEKKRITYAAQNVDVGSLAQARELNVANSMEGKVAGLDLVKSNAGVGSASRILLRGNRSIYGNNQPLIVVDGVPISNATNGSPTNENGGVQTGDGISNLNPEDIASITVLKGPNATALYGSRANNGAIVITTKKGTARKGIGVEFSSNFMFEKPIILTKFQQEYGQGSAGTYIKNSEFEWGPKLDGRMVEHWSPNPNWDGPAQYAFVAHPNNLKDFFVTGSNMANTLAINTGNEKSQVYFSYTNTQAQGIVSNNNMQRNNFNLRFTSKLSKRLSADAKLTYFNQGISNIVHTGDDFANPMRAIYRQPTNISLDDARNFEYFDDAGNRLQNYWNPHSNGGENVFWLINRTYRRDIRDRILGVASLRYELAEGLNFMVRSSFDKIYDKYRFYYFYDTYTIGDRGDYGLWRNDRLEMNNDFLLSYTKKFGDALSLDASFGGNMLLLTGDGASFGVARNMLKPNLFVISNTSHISGGEWGSTKKVNSLYGLATLGFKNFLFLEITGRNDWSSTLPKKNWSYFYPSAGLTWVISDMIDMPAFMPFAKLRASYAYVGNDTDPYMLNLTYSFGAGGNLGYAHKSSTLPAKDLKPEITRSIEFGGNVAFFENRLGLDFTWYKTNSYNQLIRVPLPSPSGFSSKFINAGNIQNKGIELTLRGTPVTGDFKWDIAFNYSMNNSLVVKLTEDLKEYTIRGRSWMTTFKVKEGSEYGDVYTKGFLRDDQGNILVNGSTGLPMVSDGQTIPMGNYNPDWLGGITNTFTYKGFDLNILFDIRMGGNIFSFTQANLASDGFADYTLKGRDGMVVDGVIPTYDTDGNIVSTTPNTIEITAEDYWQSLGGRNTPTGEPFKYDASFVRFRELVLGYNISFKNNSVIRKMRLALVGRNLGFLYNAAKVLDPNLSVGTSNVQGMEGFGLPTTRTFGANMKLTF